jgi:hypothetical protein
MMLRDSAHYGILLITVCLLLQIFPSFWTSDLLIISQSAFRSQVYDGRGIQHAQVCVLFNDAFSGAGYYSVEWQDG